MKELTLNDKLHYYLPYNLKMLPPNGTEYTMGGFKMPDIVYCSKGLFMGNGHPCFRHVSDMSKEITVEGYNDGKPFVPVVELYKIAREQDINRIESFGFLEDVINRGYANWYKDNPELVVMPPIDYTKRGFWIAELLFTWHFWLWEDEYFDKGLILKIQ